MQTRKSLIEAKGMFNE